MDLSINISKVVFHLAIYLGALVLLKFLYIDPVLRLLKRREELTGGKAGSAQALSTKSAQLRDQISKRMSQMRAEIEEGRQKVLKEVQAECEERLARGKRENEARMRKLEEQLTQELTGLRKDMTDPAAIVSREIVEALMSGRVVRA